MSLLAENSTVLLLLSLGLVAGVLSALLGVGSGILVVPAMVLVFGLSQKSAQGTALALMIPMALAGTLRYLSNPDVHIDFWQVTILALGTLVGVMIGSLIVSRLSNEMLQRLFAIFLIIVAGRLLWHAHSTNHKLDPGTQKITETSDPGN